MNRRQWIGFIVFPAAIASLLAFLFFVAKVDVFRQRTGPELLAEVRGARDAKIRMQAAGQIKARVLEGKLEVGPAAEALNAALADEAVDVRMAAAEALSAVLRDASGAALARLLREDEHPDVRKLAAFLLGSVKADDQRGALVQALDDAAPPVRWNAAVALARLGDAAGLPALHDMLQPPAPRSVQKALGYMLPTGETLQVEPDHDVHANAIYALALVGDQTSLGPLARFVEAEVDPSLDEATRFAAKAIEKRLAESTP